MAPNSPRGDLLALGIMGSLAVASQLRARRPVGGMNRGSFAALSQLQQRLLRVKNEYAGDPEVAFRAMDTVISMLPDLTSSQNSTGLPGIWANNVTLLRDVQTMTGNPQAGFRDLVDILVPLIRDNSYVLGADKVADLSQEWAHERYIPWIAREVSRAVKAARASKDEDSSKKSALADYKRRVSHIFDWTYATTPNLMNYKFDEAYQASDEWHQRAQEQVRASVIKRRRAEGKYFDCPGGVATQKGEVVVSFPNGWTVQKLTTAKQLLEEGNTDEESGRGCLLHCIGSYGYFDEAQKGNQEHYSLRTPDNKPIVTFTVRLPQRDTVQMKGWSNRIAASIDKAYGSTEESRRNYANNLAVRLNRKDIEAYLDEEALMLKEAFRVLKIQPATDSEPMVRRLQKVAEQQRKKKAGGAPELQDGRDVAFQQGAGNRRGPAGRLR